MTRTFWAFVIASTVSISVLPDRVIAQERCASDRCNEEEHLPEYRGKEPPPRSGTKGLGTIDSQLPDQDPDRRSSTDLGTRAEAQESDNGDFAPTPAKGRKRGGIGAEDSTR